jgi:hypothetical protein
MHEAIPETGVDRRRAIVFAPYHPLTMKKEKVEIEE